MEVSAQKLPTHKHPLYPSTRFLLARCQGCCVRGQIYGGYRCNESDCYNKVNKGGWFHKECGESPSETNHPSHPQHPLTFNAELGYSRCHLCGFSIESGYCCAICDFVIDMTCAQKPPPPIAIEHPMFHEHSLVRTKKRQLVYPCKICKNHIAEGYPYECLTCEDVFHLDCVNQSREVNHSSHSSHILEFFTSESLPENAEKTCILCGIELHHVLYHCSKCNFSICVSCKRNPPPLTVQHTKTHMHTLSLLSRRVSFTCNVCGLQGDRSPYSCIQCSFLVHRECIDLPRVININRHDHRISLTDHIGPRGNLKCGVCHQSVNQYCGGYTCSICPSFVVHSSCPTKREVWDGVELEGIPEEEVIAPFEVVGDNLIQHFSHEDHILRLESDGYTTRDEKIRCEACISPVDSGPIYSCEQCDFILHETCANLPMKKRLPFYNIQFELYAPDIDPYEAFECYACKTMFSGFRYAAHHITIDVRCGTFTELESYDFHDHPTVYYGKNKRFRSCGACQRGEVSQEMLSCDDCDFVLDFRCFNLPREVKHREDEPPLSLCYGEDPNGKYWCDICEGETNPKYWFYTCSDSGATLHVQCVLGDFSFLMPRRMIKYSWYCKFEVVPNNHCSRPFCACCRSRCIGPFFLKISNPEIVYICSELCLTKIITTPTFTEYSKKLFQTYISGGKTLHV